MRFVLSLILFVLLANVASAQSIADRLSALENKFAAQDAKIDKLQASIDDVNTMLMATNRRLDALTNEPKQTAAPTTTTLPIPWQSAAAPGSWSSSSSMMSSGGCSGGSCGASGSGRMGIFRGRR